MEARGVFSDPNGLAGLVSDYSGGRRAAFDWCERGRRRDEQDFGSVRQSVSQSVGRQSTDAVQRLTISNQIDLGHLSFLRLLVCIPHQLRHTMIAPSLRHAVARTASSSVAATTASSTSTRCLSTAARVATTAPSSTPNQQTRRGYASPSSPNQLAQPIEVQQPNVRAGRGSSQRKIQTTGGHRGELQKDAEHTACHYRSPLLTH